MPKFQPKDVIAILTIIFIVWMKIKGMNGGLDAAIAVILGYYFVKRHDKIDDGK